MAGMDTAGKRQLKDLILWIDTDLIGRSYSSGFVDRLDFAEGLYFGLVCGVMYIHQCSTTDAEKILEPYLPLHPSGNAMSIGYPTTTDLGNVLLYCGESYIFDRAIDDREQRRRKYYARGLFTALVGCFMAFENFNFSAAIGIVQGFIPSDMDGLIVTDTWRDDLRRILTYRHKD